MTIGHLAVLMSFGVSTERTFHERFYVDDPSHTLPVPHYLDALPKNKSPRPGYQRKQGKPGAKSLRGCPEIYDEKKQQFNVTLTPKAIAILAEIATTIGESRSQVIEKAIRGEINLLQILENKIITLEEMEKMSDECDEVSLINP